MPETHNRTITEIVEQLMREGPQAMAPVMSALMNLAMRMEREQFLGAGHYECQATPGFDPDCFKTRSVI